MAQHALLSPSAAEKWFACPGAVAMEAGVPDESSGYADEGTAAHFLAALCLDRGAAPSEFIDREILVGEDPVTGFDGAIWAADKSGTFEPRGEYRVDMDMAGHVNTYVEAVRGFAVGGALFVEQRLPITPWTGEPDAFGTSDAVVITQDELQVHDLKFGMGERVSAEANKQLMMYALAAYQEFGDAGDINRIRLVIHQPRVSGAADEWSLSVEDLAAFGEEVRTAARQALHAYEFRGNWVGKPDVPGYLAPSADGCRWCRAKATCPALDRFVTDIVGADFEDLTAAPDVSSDSANMLGIRLSACPLIEKWIAAVRAEAERRLLEGKPVTGYKLVQGKRGNRKWSDPDEAEAMMKATFRLKTEEMYKLSLISPTEAEKLAKAGMIGPRQWPRLASMIVQAEGAPSVAPESDKRPALVLDAAAGFEDETGEDMV